MKNLILLISFFFATILSTSAQVEIFFINTHTGIEKTKTGKVVRQLLVPAHVTVAQGIAVNHEEGRVYWTDWGNKKIQSSDFNGNQIKVILDKGLNLPEGIALDIQNKKIYWVDSGNKKVQRANMDGTQVEDLYSYVNVNLDAIALDVANDKMYWTDWGAGAAFGRVLRAKLDGSQVEVLVSIHNAIIKGLALDLDNKKIYWTDCGFDKIQRSDLDGKQIEDLISTGLTTPNSIALDIENGKMYWSDLGRKKIQRANLDGSMIEDIIKHNLDTPQGIALSFCAGIGSDCWATSVDGKLDAPEIQLFPNPITDLMHIEGLELGDLLSIYDLYGRLILRKKMTETQGQLQLNLASWPSGYFHLQLIRKDHRAAVVPFARN